MRLTVKFVEVGPDPEKEVEISTESFEGKSETKILVDIRKRREALEGKSEEDNLTYVHILDASFAETDDLMISSRIFDRLEDAVN